MYIPVHAGNIHLSATYDGFYMNYSLCVNGKRYTQTSNTDSFYASVLNPYLLNDLFIGKEITLQKIKGTMQIGVCNIFGAEYQVIRSRPMPGRNYSVMLDVSF
jgi:iron complex outermembrane receptor protein